jgi:hypothetical protein
MVIVFLIMNGDILINWLAPGEKFKGNYFCEKDSSRFARSCTAAALHGPQG